MSVINQIHFFAEKVGNVKHVNNLLNQEGDLNVQQIVNVRTLIRRYLDEVEQGYPCILSEDERRIFAADLLRIIPTHISKQNAALESGLYDRGQKVSGSSMHFVDIEEYRERLQLCCLSELFVVLPNLKFIENLNATKTSIDEFQMRDISYYCLALKRIRLSECPNVTDEGIKFLVKRCKSIEGLELNVTSLTDKALMCIGNYCRTLKALCLEKCPNVTDEGIEAIAKSCSDLHTIFINGCSGLTAASISALIRHSSGICEVGFPSHKDVNDSLLEEFATKFGSTLETIELKGCSSLTDTSIRTLAMHSPHLKNVVVAGCEHLTGLSGYHLATHCPDLKREGLEADEIVMNAFEAQKKRIKPQAQVSPTSSRMGAPVPTQIDTAAKTDSLSSLCAQFSKMNIISRENNRNTGSLLSSQLAMHNRL